MLGPSWALAPLVVGNFSKDSCDSVRLHAYYLLHGRMAACYFLTLDSIAKQQSQHDSVKKLPSFLRRCLSQRN
jgi:hypothetical protein